jgi:hypothetical protein
MGLRAAFGKRAGRWPSHRDRRRRQHDGHRRRRQAGAACMLGSLVIHEGFAGARDDVAVDELLLAACSVAQGGGGEAVDLA